MRRLTLPVGGLRVMRKSSEHGICLHPPGVRNYGWAASLPLKSFPQAVAFPTTMTVQRKGVR
jgi:hypothetical protein